MAKQMKLNENSVGLALGYIFAVWHFGWIVVLSLGGQRALDWIFNIHLIASIGFVPVSAVTALLGIVGAFVCGWVTGWISAWIWNRTVRMK